MAKSYLPNVAYSPSKNRKTSLLPDVLYESDKAYRNRLDPSVRKDNILTSYNTKARAAREEYKKNPLPNIKLTEESYIPSADPTGEAGFWLLENGANFSTREMDLIYEKIRTTAKSEKGDDWFSLNAKSIVQQMDEIKAESMSSIGFKGIPAVTTFTDISNFKEQKSEEKINENILPSISKKVKTGETFTDDELTYIKKQGLSSFLPSGEEAELLSPYKSFEYQKQGYSNDIVAKLAQAGLLPEGATEEDKKIFNTDNVYNFYKKIKMSRTKGDVLEAIDTAYHFSSEERNQMYDYYSQGDNWKELALTPNQQEGLIEFNKVKDGSGYDGSKINTRTELFLETGFTNFFGGVVETGKALVQGTNYTPSDSSKYEYASQYLSNYFTKTGQYGQRIFQETVTNVAQNLIPILLGGAIGGGAGTFVNLASFGLSTFGHSFKEGWQLSNIDNIDKSNVRAYLNEYNNVLSYALTSTAFEIGLEKVAELIGPKIPGVSGLSDLITRNFKSLALKIPAKTVLSGVGEFTEESLQFVISPILQNIHFKTGNETIFTDFKGQLSEAAYAGFIGFLSGTVMGGFNAMAESKQEKNISQLGRDYKKSFDFAGVEAKSVASYFKEVSNHDSTLYQLAEKVEDGDTSDWAVGEMIAEALNVHLDAYVKINEAVGKTVEENGSLATIVSEYESLLKEGLIFPDKINKLYETIKPNIKTPQQIENADIGKFVMSVQMHSPKSLIMREMVKQVELTDRNVDYTPDESVLQPVDLSGNSGLNAGEDSGIINNNNNTNLRGEEDAEQGTIETEISTHKRAENQLQKENAGIDGYVARGTGTVLEEATESRGRRVRVNYKKSSVIFTEGKKENTTGYRAYLAFQSDGTNVIYCDGEIIRNVDGEGIVRTDSFTAPDGTVYISSLCELSEKEIYDHERVHVAERKNTIGYHSYYNTLNDVAVFTSDTYEDLADTINREQFTKEVIKDSVTGEILEKIGKYDISDVDTVPIFLREIAAYVNQFVLSDPNYAEQLFGGMFSDWNAVVEAVHTFNSQMEIDKSVTDPATDEIGLTAEEEKLLNTPDDKLSDAKKIAKYRLKQKLKEQKQKASVVPKTQQKNTTQNGDVNSENTVDNGLNNELSDVKADLDKAVAYYVENNIDDVEADIKTVRIKNIFAGTRKAFVRRLSNGTYESGTYGTGSGGFVSNENIIRTDSLEEAIAEQYKYMLQNGGEEGNRMIRKRANAYDNAHKTEVQYNLSRDELIENENIANGKKAIDELIDKADKDSETENLSIKNAMYRSDLGYIDFVWGKPGEGPKFKKGYGLAHIIAKRDAESGNGKEVAYELVNVLAKGTKIETQRVQNISGNDRIRILYNNYTAVLSESPEGNRWLLTGWENKEETTTSANEEVRDSSKATTVTPTLTRRNRDVAVSKISIPNPDESVKEIVENSDTDSEHTDNDMYAKEESQWKAEHKNDKTVSKSLKDKLARLFGSKKDGKVTSIGEIVKEIEKDFAVPVSKGKFRQKAYGIYKNKSQAIRTKVTNALPTIAHELGHHIDNKYHLRNFESIGEAERVLKETRPNFYNSYKPDARPREAVAEFMRDYLADRTMAKEKYPFFFEEFERKLLETAEGKKDLENLKKIGDKINEYYHAETRDRVRAAIVSRKEAKKRDLLGTSLSDVLEKVQTDWLDDAVALKKISKKAYDLYYLAKKSSVRAKNMITGYYMAGFNGEYANLRDKDGNVIKDEDGNGILVPALKYILADISNGEMRNDFNDYLVYRHGLEWLREGKRVFADDTANNSAYMQREIARLEQQYPEFKETAENFYIWYQTFVYEYGVESGLLSKEQYKNLVDKYPCYVPFMRNIDRKKANGTKSGVANQNAPIKRAKGSGAEIFDVLESTVLKVEQFIKAAERNAVMQEIANTVDDEGGFGWLIEQVPPDMMPKTISSKSIKNIAKAELSNMGADENAIDDFSALIDEVIGESVTEFQISFNQGANVVAVRRNGKRTLYQVHDDGLLAALTGMNPEQFDFFTRSMGAVTRIFKTLTTGGNAVWSLVSNAPRDFDSAYKYGSENNPIKYTVDYIKAIYYQMNKNNDWIKLYRTLGGGYNNSFVNASELNITMRGLFENEGFVERIKSFFNIIENVTKLADFVETAPRLAEFKRVYLATNDAKKAMLAAEEVTVNFNRSGKKAKVIDKWVPYFNASLQANQKFARHLGESLKPGGDKSFLVKSITTAIIKTALIFGILGLYGDEGKEEYEKLSAYKKNNFYNIYVGGGKFISIPKSQATGVFDSLVERVFEIAMKEDVDWGQEIKDFSGYMWLTFGPPLIDDVAIGGTVLELAKNEDFTGAPIVPSYYEDLEAEMQYNEKTTHIAKAIGQIFGLSPMKIDHIIESNFGYLGLLNKSLGREEKDWSLGTKTKVLTDSAYSTDVFNNFYDKADDYESKAKSYPDNAEYVYLNKQYTAAKSVVSSLNSYGKDEPDSVREYKILARDYVSEFEKNVTHRDKLSELYEATKNDDIFYHRSIKPTYTKEKVEYKMDFEEYMDFVDEYYSEVEKEYNKIFDMNLSNDTTVKMLIDAKNDVYTETSKKYKMIKN